MALTIRGLTFSYGAASLFDGFNADFPRGAVTAVTGPNGCGKTTLARLLVGILKARAGEILIDGEPVPRMTLTEVGRKIGYVTQDPGRQIFKVSVEEEMMFGLRNIGVGESEAEARSDEYLKRFGLSDKKGAFPFELSTGERQRLVLAAVLAMKPPYLMLDEPTSSLDPGRRRALGVYLTETMKKDGTGIVLISHDRKFVSEYANARVDIGERPAPGETSAEYTDERAGRGEDER
jgi:energy-coupling factor transport system ATP-binding protein